jgi:hypothetical protein
MLAQRFSRAICWRCAVPLGSCAVRTAAPTRGEHRPRDGDGRALLRLLRASRGIPILGGRLVPSACAHVAGPLHRPIPPVVSKACQSSCNEPAGVIPVGCLSRSGRTEPAGSGTYRTAAALGRIAPEVEWGPRRQRVEVPDHGLPGDQPVAVTSNSSAAERGPLASLESDHELDLRRVAVEEPKALNPGRTGLHRVPPTGFHEIRVQILCVLSPFSRASGSRGCAPKTTWKASCGCRNPDHRAHLDFRRRDSDRNDGVWRSRLQVVYPVRQARQAPLGLSPPEAQARGTEIARLSSPSTGSEPSNRRRPAVQNCRVRRTSAADLQMRRPPQHLLAKFWWLSARGTGCRRAEAPESPESTRRHPGLGR